ncbi:two-component sensor histidine kinase, partial [Methylobacterium sp. WL18]
MGVGRAAHVRICVGALTLTAASAALAELPETATTHAPREMHSVAALAIFGGLVAFAVILSLLHLYERGRWTRRERELAGALDVLRGAHDRAEMLLNAERQVIVTWDRRSEPVVEGDISLAIYGERPTSGYARRVLAFGTWLVASDAAAVEAAVETLRARGTSFSLSLRTQTGRSIDAHGQAVAGRALLRLRETSQERCEIADLRAT